MAARLYPGLFFKRSYSAAASEAVIRPPIAVHGVQGKYASALYSSGVKEKLLDTLEKEISKVNDLYQTNKDFKLFVDNPLIDKLRKKDAIQAVLKAQGLSKQTQNFFGVLAENGKLKLLPAVAASFDEIMRAHRGELRVQVTSAEPLSKAQEQALHDALKKHAKTGQKLNLAFEVKPSLLGGVLVTIGDKYIDLSIALKLKKLEETLHTTI